MSSDRLFKRCVSTSLSERNSRSSFFLPLIFSLHFRRNCTSSVFFLKLGSFQVLPWNLRQLTSYFFAFIIYSINLLKTARKTFATGNAIYPLPRTIIQITNANSIFRKEGIRHPPWNYPLILNKLQISTNYEKRILKLCCTFYCSC